MFAARDRRVGSDSISGQTPFFRFELLTVLILFGLGLAFARPELEGWGVFVADKAAGFIGGLRQFYIGVPSRLLEPFPLGLAWLMGHGAAWAVGLVYGILIATKYVIARWAVVPIADGGTAWILATVAAVMLPWTEQWRDHNMAQQLAAAFLLVYVGTALRLCHRNSIALVLLGALAVFFSLVTYEALIVCALVIPLIAFIVAPRFGAAFVRCGTAVAIGSIVFAAFFLWGQEAHDASAHTYHAVLITGGAYRHPLVVIREFYGTTYFSSPWTVIALTGVGAGVALPTLATVRGKQAVILFLFGIVLIPFLSLPYAVNFYFLSDIERVAYPVGFGFFLLCVALAAMSRSGSPNRAAYLVVASLLVATATNAYECYRPYGLQRAVLDQIEPIVHAHPAPITIVRDWTGKLGDMYTFLYSATLTQAMSAEGVPAKIELCTPASVERFHPRMIQVGGVSAVPRCDNLPKITGARAVIDIRANPERPNGPPTVTRVGSADVQVTKGSVGGREGAAFWWINEPQASILITNITGAESPVTVNGTLIPPPCLGEKPSVTMSLDGRVTKYLVDHSVPFQIKITLPPSGQQVVQLTTTGNPCRPVLDARTFYFGISGMSAE